MPNEEMAEFWNTRGGELWVKEQERYDLRSAPMTRRLLEAAAPSPGEAVLDVGCGTGTTTIAIARHVGDSGRTIGLDISAPMLELALQRAADAGVDAEFRQADAQTVELGEQFDLVVSRFGVMFFDDPAAAFTNLAGSLRSGGRMCFVCWNDMLGNEWVSVPAMAVVAHVGLPEATDPQAPGPFSLAEPDRTRRLLEDAGFTDVAIDGAGDPINVGDDPESTVSFMASDEMGRRLLEGKPAEQVQAALDAATEALRPYARGDGVWLGTSYWVVSARRS
jgi:SAM-dependent methyltransferase